MSVHSRQRTVEGVGSGIYDWKQLDDEDLTWRDNRHLMCDQTNIIWTSCIVTSGLIVFTLQQTDEIVHKIAMVVI